MKSLENQARADTMKRTGQRANAYPVLKQSQPSKEVGQMPCCRDYRDSERENNSERNSINTIGYGCSGPSFKEAGQWM